MASGEQQHPQGSGEATGGNAGRKPPSSRSPGFADQPTLAPGEFPAAAATGSQTPPPAARPDTPPPPAHDSGTGRPGSWAARSPQQRPVTDSWDRPPPGSSGALGSDPDRGEAATIAPWQSSFGGQRITAGKNIGPYPIERELGRGGMGVVYLAKDTRLNRRVAIKVLPDVFAQHPERAARFRREAQLLASLNHPNIAGIYGLEEHEGHHYIVMEFVPGDTLSERLANGPLSVDDAVHVCAQIAEGLEAAHERGVIHRDLKPGNVKITPDGLVKVLDFGLAKSSHDSGTVGGSEALQTGSLENTQEGVILGTAAYMSPEQARGRTLDKRTDVWSFGCVLYETLCGAPPFRADTISDTIALILRSEPDWSALPVDTPGRVREVLRKCLQKDPKRRLRDLGDARIELHDAYGALSGSHVDVPSEVRAIQVEEAQASPWLAQLPWIVAGVALALAATLLAVVLKGGPTGQATSAISAPLARFALAPPVQGKYDAPDGAGAVAISPDGSLLVFRARDAAGARLYLRRLDSVDAEPIADTDDGRMPFFAPDGSSVGFFTPGRLRRVGLTGAQRFVQDVASVSDDVAGAAWVSDNEIIFAAVGSSTPGLFRVPASGGSPSPLTVPDRARGEVAHVWPHVLPGGKSIVYAALTGEGQPGATIYALALNEGAQPVRVLEGYTAPRYTDGYLLCARGDSLYAVKFDADRLAVAGAPVFVNQRILSSSGRASGEFAVSRGGTLALIPGSLAQASNTLVRVPIDRAAGEAKDVLTSELVQASPRFDPRDPSRIVFASGQDGGVWAYSPAAPEPQPLVRNPLLGRPVALTFKPDGSAVTATLSVGNKWAFTTIPMDGAAQPREEYSTDRPIAASSWRPSQSSELVAVETQAATGRDIVRIASGQRTALLATPADEHSPVFSPDGRWLLYVSNESGTPRVYLRGYPDERTVVDVSQGYGEEPLWNGAAWSEASAEVLYRDRDTIKRVHVLFENGHPLVGVADTVYRGVHRAGADGVPAWDVAPDGRSIVAIRDGRADASADALHIVLGFHREIERLLAPN